MSSERDQQELIAKKEARKEYALRRKLVAQSMRQANVSGKDIKGQLKAMDRTIKEGAAEEKKYIEAMDCIRETYGTLETLCETVDTEELPVIKQMIDVVKADLKRAGKVYYADVENVWYQAMERFGDASEVFLQPGRIRPAKDPRAEDLRQAATGLLERVRSVIPEEGPDFYEKTKETPGLLRNIGKGIEANDIEYASRKQAVIHKIDLLRPGFEFDILDKGEIMRSIRSLTGSLKASIDPMAEVAETEALDLPLRLRELAAEYFPKARLNKKEMKRFAKEDKKRQKLIAKGKDVPETTPAQLEDIDSIRDDMLARLDRIKARYQEEIEALKEKDYAKAALNMLGYFEQRQLSIASKAK